MNPAIFLLTFQVSSNFQHSLRAPWIENYYHFCNSSDFAEVDGNDEVNDESVDDSEDDVVED